MIDVALNFVLAELNSYLVARTGVVDSGKAGLTRLVDDGGKGTIPNESIGVSLIAVEEERSLKAQLPDATIVNGRQVLTPPPLKVTLHVLFAANFKQYDMALRQLSLVLTFFQSRPVFTRDRFSALDGRIERLSAELASLTYEQLSQVWAVVGAKQLPSVMYRVRVVSLQDVEPSSVGAPVTTINATLHQS